MAKATPRAVLGDFSGVAYSAHGVTSRFFRKAGQPMVRTDGPDGELRSYPIRYTFGWYPLQQYLIPFPGGRLQALGLAWDNRTREAGGQRWYSLYPDEKVDHTDRLHWTGREQTWNYQCAECHSTHLRKGYDPVNDRYHTTWSEINVACEACHGPASAHLEWARSKSREEASHKGLLANLSQGNLATWRSSGATGKPQRSKPRSEHTEIETCARCHSRRGQFWPDDHPGESLDQTHRLSLLDPQLYFPDGQIKAEVYVYGSFLQSAMYRAGVTCSDCHDPHSTRLRAAGNALCTRCHEAQRYDSSKHHHHAKGSRGSACIACHMPQRTYMGVDRRADHSLRIPRPDLSLRIGTPNACGQCHAERGNRWAAATVQRWFPSSTHRGPHYGEVLYASDTGRADAAPRLRTLAADGSQAGIVRASAIERLTRIADRKALATIQPLLKDPDPLIRREAVHFLQLVDVGTRVDRGWPLLADPSRSVRLEATRLLAPLLRQQLPERWRKQLSEGVDEFMRSQRTNAERPEAHLNQGLMLAAIGRSEAARASYRKAIALDPTFTPAYVNLADLYHRAGRDEAGEAILRKGIAVVPDDAALHHALGLALVRSRRLPLAIGELASAARLAPQQPRYSYVYAVALASNGQQRKAVVVLKQALAEHPRDRDLLTTLVTVNREQGDLPEARRYLELLRRSHPDDPKGAALERTLGGAGDP